MSGAYPVTPEFSAINFKSIHRNVSSESRSGRLQVRSLGLQRWSFTAKYRGLTKAQVRSIYAFIERQRGMLDTFTIKLPDIGIPAGTATLNGTVKANGAATAGSNTVTLDGVGAGDTFIAGDFIKWANHSKVYMIVADSTGNGAVVIEPPLVADVPNNTVADNYNLSFTVRMSNDIQQFKASGGDLYGIEIDMLEELV